MVMVALKSDGTEVKHRVGKDFVLAGKATFTVQCPDGQHYTYRVTRKEASNGYPETFFVSQLTGPDNESSYTYLGKLDPFTGQVSPTKATNGRESSYAFRLLNRVLVRVWCDDHAAYEQFGFSVRHAGKCGRCGRTLTVPQSIESGIGPECAKRTDTGKYSTR